ncbi:MAG: quinone oxidoreductase [SAR324 cluster bacterium]|nr:quinone oxidoreductase [SAR324 cluster bacterium]MCZ6556751.1 quinone oxidoreductase [SAR324 cluster bacterium]MCZ6627019.1 quinone oxidoreductase [SAR324 cluster bacterium]MCZ6646554.1 quinone oxidoreductase [SAR324 cluster bacterium]MCZ6841806.1 quinone oxidoreductase [SAR324 cluster bacterium]
MKAMRVHEPGGSEVMKYEDIDTPQPGEGELLVNLDACGVNYIDTYQRSGLYPMPLPFTPGNEGAGKVEAVGDGVSGFSAGDAVCYTGVVGAYAEQAIIPAAKAINCPSGIGTDTAAAVLLQGMTAHYLCHDTYPLKQDEWCLVHAGAGGVGLLLIQMAKMLGANVIATVSTDEKAELAKGAGADHVIIYTTQDFEEETLRIVGDRKLDVVYDSVAQTTFDKGLNLLRRRGLMVLYGQSSGPVGPFELNTLNGKGSLFVTRPSLVHHTFTREELENRAGALLGMVTSGKLDVRIGATFPLAEAKAAHDALEGRQTTGKVLLKP